MRYKETASEVVKMPPEQKYGESENNVSIKDSLREKRQVPFSYFYEETEFKKYLDARNSFIKRMAALKDGTKKHDKRSQKKKYFRFKLDLPTRFGKSGKHGIRSEGTWEDDSVFDFLYYDDYGNTLLTKKNRANSKLFDDEKDMALEPLANVVAVIIEGAVEALNPVAVLAANATVEEASNVKTRRFDKFKIERLLEKLEDKFHKDIEADLRKAIVNSFVENLKQYSKETDKTRIDNPLLDDVWILAPFSFNDNNMRSSRKLFFLSLLAAPLKGALSSIGKAVVGSVVDNVVDKIFGSEEKKEPDIHIHIHINITEAVDLHSLVKDTVRETSAGVGKETVDNMIETIVSEEIKNNLRELIVQGVKNATEKGIKAVDGKWKIGARLEKSILNKAKSYLIKELSTAAEKITSAAADNILKNIADELFQEKMGTLRDKVTKPDFDLEEYFDDVLVKRKNTDSDVNNVENDPMVPWLSLTGAHFIIDTAKEVKDKLSSKTTELKYKSIHRDVTEMVEQGVSKSIEHKDSDESDWFIRSMVQTVTYTSINIFINEIDHKLEEDLKNVIKSTEKDEPKFSKDDKNPPSHVDKHKPQFDVGKVRRPAWQGCKEDDDLNAYSTNKQKKLRFMKIKGGK